MMYYLNEDKTYRPSEFTEWAEQFEEMSKSGTRHVGEDMILNKLVSTVWLGLDHNYGCDGLPLLFETMVFDGPQIGEEIYMDRYTTWEEALSGHQKAIKWVRKQYD